MGTSHTINNIDQYNVSYDIALNKDGPRYVSRGDSESDIIQIALAVAQK